MAVCKTCYTTSRSAAGVQDKDGKELCENLTKLTQLSKTVWISVGALGVAMVAMW